jgi:inactivated superfamily I helicase
MLSDDIKIYRRNHVALVSQQAVLQRLLPIYMYNGYDFVSLNALTNLELSTDLTLKLNLAERVTTRESNVVHKAKLSKAARKNKAQLVKKKSLSLSKKGAAKTPVVSRKGLITKKLRK